jgi:hypothetical protein
MNRGSSFFDKMFEESPLNLSEHPQLAPETNLGFLAPGKRNSAPNEVKPRQFKP